MTADPRTARATPLRPLRWFRRWPALVALALLVTALVPATAATAAPGDLDPSLAGDGTLELPAGTTDLTLDASIAVDTAGRIVTVTQRYDTDPIVENYALVVRRYLPSGAVDPSFGSAGSTIIENSITPGDFVFASDVTIRSDGRIVVVGSEVGTSMSSELALWRLDTDGTPDTSYGNGGVARPPVPELIGGYLSAVVPVGNAVVVAGQGPFGSDVDGIVVKIRPNGTLDPTFGTGGKVTLATMSGVDPNDDVVEALAMGPDGEFVAVVSVSDFSGFVPKAFRIARMTAAGQISSFGLLNTGSYGLPSAARAVAIDATGRALVTLEAPTATSTRADVVRLRPNNTFDPTFGTSGVAPIVDPGATVPSSGALYVQPDGRIVLVGVDGIDAGIVWLSRYRPNGSLDSSFGSAGTVVLQGNPSIFFGGMAPEPGGTLALLAGGDATVGGSFVARIDLDMRTCGGQWVTVDLTLPQPNPPGSGDDVVWGTKGADVIKAKAGADVICGRGGADVIAGGPGKDRIFGGGGPDKLKGNGNADFLRGNGANDVLNGGPGNDDCAGGSGIDVLKKCNP